jgi:hypothetical protein
MCSKVCRAALSVWPVGKYVGLVQYYIIRTMYSKQNNKLCSPVINMINCVVQYVINYVVLYVLKYLVRWSGKKKGVLVVWGPERVLPSGPVGIRDSMSRVAKKKWGEKEGNAAAGIRGMGTWACPPHWTSWNSWLHGISARCLCTMP